MTHVPVWTESSMQVGEYPVQLCIERLDDSAKERAAAVLAWLTLEALTGEHGRGDAAWHEFVAAMLRDHVTFSIANDSLALELGQDWWNEAIGRAFVQFIRDNELSPRINHHVDTLRAMGTAVGAETSLHGAN